MNSKTSRYKISDKKHQAEKNTVRISEEPLWGNPCERFGCLNSSTCWVECADANTREMCLPHALDEYEYGEDDATRAPVQYRYVKDSELEEDPCEEEFAAALDAYWFADKKGKK